MKPFAFAAVLVDGRRRRLCGEAARSRNVDNARSGQGRTRFDWRGVGYKPVVIDLALYGVILLSHEATLDVATVVP